MADAELIQWARPPVDAEAHVFYGDASRSACGKVDRPDVTVPDSMGPFPFPCDQCAEFAQGVR